MNRIAVVMKMHIRDKFTWFFIPWIIVSISFAVNLIIGSFVEKAFYTGGLTSYFGYFLAAGVFTLIQTFPFALNFSIRRTDYMFGTTAMVIIISIFSAILLVLLGELEIALNGWGTDYYFFSSPYWNEGNTFHLLWVNFICVLHLFFFGSLFSSVFLRWGVRGIYFFLVLLLLLGTIFSFFANKLGWWTEMAHWFQDHTIFELASWMGLVAVVYAGISYLLLRRATP